MNRTEFNQWWADFKTRWPSRVLDLKRDKFSGEERSEEDQKRLLRLWAEALDDVRLPEALEVNRRWFAGELETPKWFHLEDTPAFVRNAAIAARPRPATWTGPDDADADLRLLYDGKPGLLKRLVASLGEGLTHEQVAETLAKEMGPRGCRREERRYNCLYCLDEGRVEVWHPDCVFVAATEGLAAAEDFHWRVSSCSCSCDRGAKFHPRLPRYDASKHCRIVPRAGANGRSCHPKALAMLGQWIEDWRRARRKEVSDPLFDGVEAQ